MQEEAPYQLVGNERHVTLDSQGANVPEWGYVISGDGPTQVIWVDANGLADFCGLRVGDQILKVNGRDVSRMSRPDVVAVLQLFTVRAVLVVKQASALPPRRAAGPRAPMPSRAARVCVRVSCGVNMLPAVQARP